MFRKGDKVKVLKKPKNCRNCVNCKFIGKIGTIADPDYDINKYSEKQIWVYPFDHFDGGCSGFLESDLELVESSLKEFGIVKFCKELYAF